MAGESSESSSSGRLFEITSEWCLDYCIYQVWKEFKEKRSVSDCWKDAVQDYLLSKRFHIGQGMSNKVQCIRFIIGLVDLQQGDVQSSQESSEELFSEEESESRLLGCDCVVFFDKIVKIYPFSSAEECHMRNALKLQIILSHYRQGLMNKAKNLYSKLYSEDGYDEEYQDDIRELFQLDSDIQKEAILRKHTYVKFLNQVQQFFTPIWKKFETPILEETSFVVDEGESCRTKGLRIDARTLKALFFTWDQSEEAEQNWLSVAEGTHHDIIALKNKTKRTNNEDTPSQRGVNSPAMRKDPQQITQSKGAASSCEKTSLTLNIQRCDEVMKNLKNSSRRLFTGLKDAYSDMIVGDAGPSAVHDSDNSLKRQCKPVVAVPDSPSGRNIDKKGKKPLETRATKRRYNEEQSDAELVEWDSDDETDSDEKQRAIKLRSPPKRRCLNVKLPEVRSRKFWGDEETKWLQKGVKVYGEGNWAQILRAYPFVGRTSVNLKDRWRNLRKNNKY